MDEKIDNLEQKTEQIAVLDDLMVEFNLNDDRLEKMVEGHEKVLKAILITKDSN